MEYTLTHVVKILYVGVGTIKIIGEVKCRLPHKRFLFLVNICFFVFLKEQKIIILN